MTPAPQRRERKAQRTPTGNEETAPPTARRNRTAGGAERTHPSGRPRRGDRESPPPRSGSGRKGWRRGEPRGATEGAAQSEGNGAARASRSAERPRPTEPKGAEKAREGATGKGARNERLRSPCRETDEGASGATGRSGGWHHAAAAERARCQRPPPQRGRLA